MADLIKGLEQNRVKEVFGAGTACVVSPVNKILYQGKVSRDTDSAVLPESRMISVTVLSYKEPCRLR